MSPQVACGHVSWRQLITSRFFYWQQNSLVYPNAGLFAIIGQSVSCKNVPLVQNIPRFMYHLPCCSFLGNGLTCHYSVFISPCLSPFSACSHLIVNRTISFFYKLFQHSVLMADGKFDQQLITEFDGSDQSFSIIE